MLIGVLHEEALTIVLWGLKSVIRVRDLKASFIGKHVALSPQPRAMMAGGRGDLHRAGVTIVVDKPLGRLSTIGVVAHDTLHRQSLKELGPHSQIGEVLQLGVPDLDLLAAARPVGRRLELRAGRWADYDRVLLQIHDVDDQIELTAKGFAELVSCQHEASHGVNARSPMAGPLNDQTVDRCGAPPHWPPDILAVPLKVDACNNKRKRVRVKHY